MRSRAVIVPWLGAVVAALLLAGCGSLLSVAGTSGTSQAGTTTPPQPPASVTATAAGASVSVSTNANLGPILVDAQGRTLYLYTKDKTGTSTCTGSCTTSWPPVTAVGAPTAGPAVQGTISTITRADGSKQVAINGQPLYLYVGDAQPGETNGQGSGGDWFAVTPTGGQATGGAVTSSNATVQVSNNPTLGNLLVNKDGLTLYLYTKDTVGVSNCTGGCLAIWPVLSGNTAPTAGPGVVGTLGVMTRPDGTKQVTINGQPLYVYSGDTHPGDVTGEGSDNAWYAVKPNGGELVGAVGGGAG